MSDPSFFTTPTGIAVIAAGSSFAAGLFGTFISTWTTRTTHSQRLAADERLATRRLDFDKELAERKFAADIALSQKKFELDARLADRKRRQDLAEEVLSGFYQMADIIRAIRSPVSYVDEGKNRPKQAGEKEDVAGLRDTYFAIVERFEAHRKEMADLLARRYRLSAWFGKEAEEPFEIIYRSLSTIIVSARLLIDWAGDDLQASSPDNAALWKKMRGDIWQGAITPDTIGDEVSRAISLIEGICHPILQGDSK